MNKTEYLQRELKALQRRVGRSAAQARGDREATRERLEEEVQRNDEADAALVEVGGMAADNAAAADEVMTAQVELAEMVDAALTRQDETDAALVELAEIVTGGGEV